MKTLNEKGQAALWTIILLAIIAIGMIIVMQGVGAVHALGNTTVIYNLYNGVTFGDCMADGATKDLSSNGGDKYAHIDSYCGNESSTTVDSKVKHSNNNISSTVATQPVVIETPNPVVTEEPTDTPNKNKCNAGKGNGSEGNPDCDPGNSGGHNHGGD